MITIQKGSKGKAQITASIIDYTTRDQIQGLIDSPVAEGSNVVIMPDCHAGAGCVIGTTMTIENRVCPNLVGVDIGCGVLAYNFGNEDIDMDRIDAACHTIPTGFRISPKENKEVVARIKKLTCFDALRNVEKLNCLAGSLGGGNHFIEIGESGNTGDKYLIVHSGSRNLGLQVAQYHQKIARKQHPFGDLSYLTGQEMMNYLYDMRLTQEIATINREAIASAVIAEYFKGRRRIKFPFDRVESVHNFIDHERGILRKGAISAELGQVCIIPMNMAYGCIIGTGKGVEEWNYSAPHGAGRIMSRSQAKKTLDLADFEESMKDVVSSTICQGTIDEAPMVYKNAETIIDDLEDTIEITDRLTSIYNFKAV